MCNDPAISYLKSIGFSVLRLPRPDMRPLQLLADYGRELTDIGDLGTVMPPAAEALPAVEVDLPGASITGELASTLSVGLGLNLLGSVLGAMGAGNVGLDGAYKAASKVTFQFTDTQIDRVAIAKVDGYLGSTDVDPNARGVAQLLDADDVYVVTATIKSKKITVTSKSDSGSDVTVKVPVIKEVVGGNVSVKASADESSTITYEGSVPLVFGFQAIRLFYDGAQYTSFKPLDAGKKVARALEKDMGLPDAVEPLDRSAPLLRISLM